MNAAELMKTFILKCPFAVLTQLAIRGLAREELDEVFQENRSRQYLSEVMFSDIAVAVADVTLGFSDNFNRTYKAHRETLGVSAGSF